MKKGFYLSVFMLVSGWVFALQPPTDSTVLKSPKQKQALSVVARVHSMGIFSFMGKVVNYNPAADIFFTYTSRSSWGVSVFKVADLSDIHSHNNFAFALINKTLRAGPRLTITPNVGVALEQQNKFADHGSGVMALLTSTFRINKNLALEHNALFNNLLFETKYRDWTNRLRVLYSMGHLDIIGMLWHNNGFIDDTNYFSTGVSIFYNRISLGKKIWLGGGVTGMLTANQSNPELPHHKKGIQLTSSITIK